MRAACVLLAVLGACETPALERDCEDDADGVIEGRVITEQVTGVLRTDLTVRGVASHSEGRVIRRSTGISA